MAATAREDEGLTAADKESEGVSVEGDQSYICFLYQFFLSILVLRKMAATAREEKGLTAADKESEGVSVEGEKVEEVREKLEGAELGEEKLASDDKKQPESKEREESEKQEVEPKTGISFPAKLGDGKQLGAMGLRRKKILAIGINIYAFGIYADDIMLKELLKTKFSQPPQNPTKELYEAVIDSDIGMMVRLVIVFKGLTMNLVRKNFDEGLGASLKKLTGGQKNEELVNMVMGASKDSIKLPPGSTIEITRLPGYVLETKVKGEVVSNVESELLCRAYFHMYLGDDVFDKDAKDKFGEFLLTLF